ncbi:MAG: hypothetical protein IVW51_16720 [Thermaceae bacterium]|nr:hypothetical protein [Thermaceae bacterium]
MNADTPIWQVFISAALLALSGAVLRVLVDSVQSLAWKKALRILSSAFWGGIAAIFLSGWLKMERSGMMAAAVMFGWMGYEAVLETVGRILASRARETEKK